MQDEKTLVFNGHSYAIFSIEIVLQKEKKKKNWEHMKVPVYRSENRPLTIC